MNANCTQTGHFDISPTPAPIQRILTTDCTDPACGTGGTDGGERNPCQSVRSVVKYHLSVLTADFDYQLPEELIAQHPARERDQSRLMVLNRADESIKHHVFKEIPRLLKPGSVLILNDSKVLRARLRGMKAGSTTRMEMLLLEENSTNDWWV